MEVVTRLYMIFQIAVPSPYFEVGQREVRSGGEKHAAQSKNVGVWMYVSIAMCLKVYRCFHDRGGILIRCKSYSKR